MRKKFFTLCSIFVVCVCLAGSTFAISPDDLISDSPILMTSVPVSGSSSSDPVIVGYDYVPDAPDGSLLSVLYGLIGKPITAVHYQYRTGNTSNIQTVYSTVDLDYDAHWITSCALLICFVYCIFRLGGSLLCKK